MTIDPSKLYLERELCGLLSVKPAWARKHIRHGAIARKRWYRGADVLSAFEVRMPRLGADECQAQQKRPNATRELFTLSAEEQRQRDRLLEKSERSRLRK